jgi:hypothetical protein
MFVVAGACFIYLLLFFLFLQRVGAFCLTPNSLPSVHLVLSVDVSAPCCCCVLALFGVCSYTDFSTDPLH